MILVTLLALLILGALVWAIFVSLPAILFCVSVALHVLLGSVMHPLSYIAKELQSSRQEVIVTDVMCGVMAVGGIYLLHFLAYPTSYWNEVHAVTMWLVVALCVKTVILVAYHGLIRKFKDSDTEKKRYKKGRMNIRA